MTMQIYQQELKIKTRLLTSTHKETIAVLWWLKNEIKYNNLYNNFECFFFLFICLFFFPLNSRFLRYMAVQLLSSVWHQKRVDHFSTSGQEKSRCCVQLVRITAFDICLASQIQPTPVWIAFNITGKGLVTLGRFPCATSMGLVGSSLRD